MKIDKSLKVAYQEAVERAKENLKGEDLEKCLIALNNYMDHVQNS